MTPIESRTLINPPIQKEGDGHTWVVGGEKKMSSLANLIDRLVIPDQGSTRGQLLSHPEVVILPPYL
jgi:alpha-D-ribose 1-methylphosphonate 5-triphosphate synthase subunit PhnG